MDYQRPAFEKLVRLGRAVKAASFQSIAIKCRTTTLIVGPSGSGKSHLARIVAGELGEGLGSHFLTVSALEWVPICSGTRGAETTWKLLAQVLLSAIKTPEDKPGKRPIVVIFIDEIDKLSGTTDWAGYIRTECFTLLDKVLPLGLKDKDDDIYCPKQRERMQEVLSRRTLILAAGAFQHLWDARGKPQMGFGESPKDESVPDLSRLVETLPRELVNRFRADLVVLPEPKESDYQDMLLRSADLLPAEMQNGFLALGETRIEKAIVCRSGFRFVEELLIDFLIEWEEMRPKLEWKEVKTEIPNIRLQLCERLVDRHFENLTKKAEQGTDTAGGTLSGHLHMQKTFLMK